MAGLLGAVAGAIGGAGAAVQENARSEIQKRKEQALLDLRNRYAMERQDDQQTFTASQNEQDRSFRAEQSQADRQQRRELAEMQEAGASSRSANGAWTVMPTENGGYTRFNTATGETSSLPEGVDYGAMADGKLGAREELMFKQYGDQIKQIDKALTEDAAMLSDARRGELKAERNRLANQQRQIIGMETQTPDLVSRLEASLEEPADDTSGQPRDFDSALGGVKEQRESEQQARDDEARAEALETEVDQIVNDAQGLFGQRSGLLGRNARSLTTSDDEKNQRAQELVARMRELYDDPALSNFQRQRLTRQINQMAEAGAPVFDTQQ
ncbi:hypothetical protein [Chromohalobacter canadensis]|uniref:hypothetical protein n=1 Tax=Chromohalobacter canadensis TaxID=141389 RepID=UPI00240F5A64|nr:hypothetical protein [Chromohalobacter canadensis]